jgi:hypothetical protein
MLSYLTSWLVCRALNLGYILCPCLGAVIGKTFGKPLLVDFWMVSTGPWTLVGIEARGPP